MLNVTSKVLSLKCLTAALAVFSLAAIPNLVSAGEVTNIEKYVDYQKCSASNPMDTRELTTLFRDTILTSQEFLGKYALTPRVRGYSELEIRNKINELLEVYQKIALNQTHTKEEKALYDNLFALREFLSGESEFQTKNIDIKITKDERINSEAKFNQRLKPFLYFGYNETETGLNWLTIGCKPPPNQADNSQKTEPSDSFLSRLIIAKDKSAVDAEALKKLKFAELGFTDNRISSTQNLSFHGAVISPDLWEKDQFAKLQIFSQLDKVEENKKTTTDDLLFGVALTKYNRQSNIVNSLSLHWETDTRFRSSYTTAEYSIRPFGGYFDGNTCTSIEKLNCQISLRGVVDYSHVSSSGDKTKLDDISEYARAGLDFGVGLTYGIDDGPQWQFSATHTFREALNKRFGSAQLSEYSIKFLPSDDSRFSLGLTYTKGDDLSSFERQDIIAVTLGVRNY